MKVGFKNVKDGFRPYQQGWLAVYISFYSYHGCPGIPLETTRLGWFNFDHLVYLLFS